MKTFTHLFTNFPIYNIRRIIVTNTFAGVLPRPLRGRCDVQREHVHREEQRPAVPRLAEPHGDFWQQHCWIVLQSKFIFFYSLKFKGKY